MEKRHPTCCLCIPLRLGVFLNAVFTVIGSISMIIAKRYTEDTMRIFSGGYVLQSRVIIGFIEVTGCMWGVLGIIGTWQNKASYVKIYNYYQMARVVSWIGMYYTDLPVLMSCELWIMDINKAIAEQGWNPVMYKIAFSGRCLQERWLFMIFSTLGLCFFIYLTYVNQVLQDMLEEEPKYLLRVPKDLPNGAFYTQSLGEKSTLLAQANQPRQQGVVGQPVGGPGSGTGYGMHHAV